MGPVLQPGFAVGKVLFARVRTEFCFEGGHQESNRGCAQTKRHWDKNKPRVPVAAGCDEFGT